MVSVRAGPDVSVGETTWASVGSAATTGSVVFVGAATSCVADGVGVAVGSVSSSLESSLSPRKATMRSKSPTTTPMTIQSQVGKPDCAPVDGVDGGPDGGGAAAWGCA